MGFLSFAFGSAFVPLFKQFLETEMTHCKIIYFQKSELMFRVTLNNKRGINQV